MYDTLEAMSCLGEMNMDNLEKMIFDYQSGRKLNSENT